MQDTASLWEVCTCLWMTVRGRLRQKWIKHTHCGGLTVTQCIRRCVCVYVCVVCVCVPVQDIAPNMEFPWKLICRIPFLLKPIDPMGRFTSHEEVEVCVSVCVLSEQTLLIKHCHFLTHIPWLLKHGRGGWDTHLVRKSRQNMDNNATTDGQWDRQSDADTHALKY